MNFRRLTQIFSQTRFGSLKYEECSSIGKKKILIVDDNSDLRKLLALVLKNSDYDTVEAATGLGSAKASTRDPSRSDPHGSRLCPSLLEMKQWHGSKQIH